MKPAFLERKSRVFIVDDHPLVRDGLATLIDRQADLAVCGSAADQTSALTEIARTQPHLALIDVSLGAGSGIELLKDLKIQQPELATIVFSMHDEMVYAERALRAGARGYVMKSETVTIMLQAIRRVLEGGVYLSDKMVARMASQFTGERSTASASVERVSQLSDRELEIFRLLGRGLTTAKIGTELHLSMKTVQAYCARAKEKLGVMTAVDLRRAATLWEDAHAAQVV